MLIRKAAVLFRKVISSKLFRGAVSAALIFWLVSLIEWHELLEAIQAANVWLLLVVQGVAAGQVVLSAFKWQLLLKLKGQRPSLISLTRIYYIATFFNNFLPTNIGGDAFRVLRSTRSTRHKPVESAITEPVPVVRDETAWGWEEATAAIVLERATGLVAFLIICYSGAIIGILMGYGNSLLEWIVRVGTLGGLAALLLVFLFLRKPEGLRKLSRIPAPATFRRVVAACNTYEVLDHSFLPVWVISVVFQLVMVGIVWVLAAALQIDIGFVPLMTVVPLRSLAMMLPVSINGIGIGESAYVVLLAPFGVGVERAFLIGILVRVMVTVVSIAGGVIYAWDRRPDVARHAEAPPSPVTPGQPDKPS